MKTTPDAPSPFQTEPTLMMTFKTPFPIEQTGENAFTMKVPYRDYSVLSNQAIEAAETTLGIRDGNTLMEDVITYYNRQLILRSIQ